MKNTSKTMKTYPLTNTINIPHPAPTLHTNHPSYIPLPLPSTFKIPPFPSKCNINNIPSGLMNDLPLPPDLQPILPPLPFIPNYTKTIHPLLPLLPDMISSIPLIPIFPMPHIIHKQQKRKQPKLRNKNTINLRNYNETKTLENTNINNSDNKNDSFPLGHPGRIKFIDTMSEAFTDKYKKQKRYVPHRSWARCRKCRPCNKTYPSADDYELHRMVYHSEGIQIHHPCDICGANYNERRWLNRHVRNTHFKFLCKIDGHGHDQKTVANDQLKKRKGKDSICGNRFSCYEDLIAHQAIIHKAINEYTQHSGDQGPTIKYMNGTDAKNIVIERLVWRKDEKLDSDLELDLNDITVALDTREKKIKKKSKKQIKTKKKIKCKKKKTQSKSKSRSLKKKRKNKVSDIPPCIEQQPPLKKRKMNKFTRILMNRLRE